MSDQNKNGKNGLPTRKPGQGIPNYLGQENPRGFMSPDQAYEDGKRRGIANFIMSQKFYTPKNCGEIILPTQVLKMGGQNKK